MTERYREDFFRDDFRPLFFDAPFRADLRPPFFAAPLRAPLRELLFLPADFLPPFFLVAMCGLQYWYGTLDRSPGGSVSMALARRDAVALHGLREAREARTAMSNAARCS